MAAQALKALKQAQREKLIKIENAAVLHKDEKANCHQGNRRYGRRQRRCAGGVAGRPLA